MNIKKLIVICTLTILCTGLLASEGGEPAKQGWLAWGWGGIQTCIQAVTDTFGLSSKSSRENSEKICTLTENFKRYIGDVTVENIEQFQKDHEALKALQEKITREEKKSSTEIELAIQDAPTKMANAIVVKLNKFLNKEAAEEGDAELFDNIYNAASKAQSLLTSRDKFNSLNERYQEKLKQAKAEESAKEQMKGSAEAEEQSETPEAGPAQPAEEPKEKGPAKDVSAAKEKKKLTPAERTAVITEIVNKMKTLVNEVKDANAERAAEIQGEWTTYAGKLGTLKLTKGEKQHFNTEGIKKTYKDNLKAAPAPEKEAVAEGPSAQEASEIDQLLAKLDELTGAQIDEAKQQVSTIADAANKDPNLGKFMKKMFSLMKAISDKKSVTTQERALFNAFYDALRENGRLKTEAYERQFGELAQNLQKKPIALTEIEQQIQAWVKKTDDILGQEKVKKTTLEKLQQDADAFKDDETVKSYLEKIAQRIQDIETKAAEAELQRKEEEERLAAERKKSEKQAEETARSVAEKALEGEDEEAGALAPVSTGEVSAAQRSTQPITDVKNDIMEIVRRLKTELPPDKVMEQQLKKLDIDNLKDDTAIRQAFTRLKIGAQPDRQQGEDRKLAETLSLFIAYAENKYNAAIAESPLAIVQKTEKIAHQMLDLQRDETLAARKFEELSTGEQQEVKILEQKIGLATARLAKVSERSKAAVRATIAESEARKKAIMEGA